MRKAWLHTVAASLSVAAISTTTVLANPALMAARRPAAKVSAGANASPRTVESLKGEADISPTRDPLKYMSTSFAKLPSKMPFGKGKRTVSPNMVAPPVHQQSDSIALDKPVGPPTPQLFISAAQIAESRGEIDNARNCYQQALNMWPGQVDVLRAAARMEDRIGQLPIAESLYAQAVAANPQHAGAMNDLGLCLARQGKLEASVQVLEQAIQLQPGKALYRNNAATVLVEMRQDQRALAHLAAVHGAADANYNFGQLLVQRGRAADATQYFQAAVDQNPQMEHAQVALAKLRGDVPATTVPATATHTPAVQPQQQIPTQPVAPVTAPQQSLQLNYPATARAPGYNTQSAAPTRYLPPVAARPAPVQR